MTASDNGDGLVDSALEVAMGGGTFSLNILWSS